MEKSNYDLYDRDYLRKADSISDDASSDVFEYALKSGLLAEFAAQVDAMPKYVVAKDKANYENLVPRLDAFARQHGGKIHAEVDYKHWEANIRVWIPFFECCRDDDMQLLSDIAKMAASFTIESVGDPPVSEEVAALQKDIDPKWVRITVMIGYFEEIMGDQSKGELLEEVLTSDAHMVELVENSSAVRETELLEKMEKLQQIKDTQGLDAVKDSDEFKDLLDEMGPEYSRIFLKLLAEKERQERESESDDE